MDKSIIKKIFADVVQEAIDEGLIKVVMNDAGEKMIKIIATEEQLKESINKLKEKQ